MERHELRRYGEFLTGIPFEVVALHPLADETDWLEANGVAPEACTYVDAYWRTGDRAFFVSIEGGASEARWSYFEQPDVDISSSFFVQTRVSPLTRDAMAQVLGRLQGWIESNPDCIGNLAPEETIRVASVDLAD